MPIYTYECSKGHSTERYFSVADMRNTLLCRCRRVAGLVVQPVAIHTIGTFARGIDDHDVQASIDCDGSYLDPTLSFDPETNKVVAPIKSERQRQQLIEARGLYEKAPSEKAREVQDMKRRKPKSFSATGTRA